jgi:hypothetical protein
MRVDLTPRALRLQAEHCRQLAEGHRDERIRLILTTMASEFDQQAKDAEAAPFLLTQNGEDNAR